MIGTWADYVGYPGGAALKAAGYVGAIRYVGIGSGGKRLTAAELADLRAHGLVVLGVAESTATEANNGYAAGVADAKAVLADPVAADLPFILATNDQTAWSQADVDYVRGFASVLGTRAGVYGFAPFLAACRGLVSVYWQCGDPPNMTGTQGLAHFWQRQGTTGNGSDGPALPATVQAGGVNCDINNQLLPLPGGMNVSELDDVYVQLAGPAQDGVYPGWPSYRYNPIDTKDTSFTLVNFAREIDRELNSRLKASDRKDPAARPDLDSMFGHVTSTHAVVEQLLTAVSTLTQAVAALEAKVAAQQPVVSGSFTITGSGNVSTPTTGGN